MNDELENIDDTMQNRRLARRMVNEAASKGNPIAGMLEALESLAAPFFLGVDEDPDDSDMDVYP